MDTDASVWQHLELYRYWLSKRRSSLMPARGDLSPGDIPALLPFLVIIGKADGQLWYRLVGTAVVQAAGYDATGSAVGSYLASPQDAGELQSVFERAFTAARPVFSAGEVVLNSGTHLNMSLLTLPLSDDGTSVNMTISTFAARFNSSLLAKRGWLKGLPINVIEVVEVECAEQLGKLCLEWERHSELAI
jgi:hypothetical protein